MAEITKKTMFLVVIQLHPSCNSAFYLKDSIPVMVFGESEKKVCIASITNTLVSFSENLPLSI